MQLDYSNIAITTKVAQALGFEVIVANQHIRHDELGISLCIPEGLFKHSVAMIIHIYGMKTKNEFPKKYIYNLNKYLLEQYLKSEEYEQQKSKNRNPDTERKEPSVH